MTRQLFKGFIQAIPIILGYIPIGFAYGVLAQKNGISAVNTVLMSILVFAGSAQLIAVGLFGAGVSAVSIVVTTFIVNLRHLLMSAALSPYLKRWRWWETLPFSYQITDETFALHSIYFEQNPERKAEAFGVNMTAQISWVIGSILGVFASQLITDVKPLGLDYALAAMFIGLLVLQLKNRLQVIVAILAGVASVAFYLFGMNQWNVMLAAVLASTLGVMVETWIKK
jgi:4-azaleucine resistance transporter AzlC